MTANDVSRVLDETFGGDGHSSIAFERGQGEMDMARAELLAEAVAEVPTRAMRYVQEPAEGAWHEFIEALARTYGDTATHDLLRAVEIHSRISHLR